MVFSLLAAAICLFTGEWMAAIVIAVLTIVGFLLKRGPRSEAPSTTTLQLNIGDMLVVNQGERVPADAIVIQGTALVDQYALTGEHKPHEKLVGDGVPAGSLVKAGQIKVRVTRTIQDSTVEFMRFLLREAENQPAPFERASERLSWLYVIVMGLAGAAAWAFLRDVPVMIAFFLFADSDALAYSVKLLMKSVLARSAKRGAVIKSGRSLDTLVDLNTIAFEKASLVTHADLHVGKLEHDPSISDAFVWECMAVAEKYSEHVVGRALFRTAAKHVGVMPDPDEFQAFPGKGIFAVLQSHEILIGTAELLRARDISFDRDWLSGSTSPVEGTGSDTFVALDGTCIARIRLQDRPQNEMRESIERLREIGVSTLILFTNDTVRIAGSFAQAIGVSDYRPSMKAEDVSHEIGRLSQTGTVALVGEDMRHAQALLRADLGIVMGRAGRGLHSEAAGLVLMTDDLTRLPETILLARRTRRLWKYTILYWITMNVLGIGLVLVGILNPLFAALFAFLLLRLPLLNAPRWMLR